MKSGFVMSKPTESIGVRRCAFDHAGRVLAAHLVIGFGISEDANIAEVVGPHLARALGQIVGRYGPTVSPHIAMVLTYTRSPGVLPRLSTEPHQIL
ncbi:DUF5073 family protein [Mycobacterium tuberculosis]|nr:DUF5073 family protein [Mycobacterium tuberculosis]WIY18970.1 DUF5073 family protein [Mycobacterium tuberculosis]